MDYYKRPQNVPKEAIYYEKDKRWWLNFHNCPQVDFSKKAYGWDKEGILCWEIVYKAMDGSAWSYKVFTPNGEVWQEGTFHDCLRTININYLVENYFDSTRLFKHYYHPPQGTVKIVDTEFNTKDQVLKCAYYDNNNVLLGSDERQDPSTPLAWKLHQIGVAFNNRNFRLAYQYTQECELLLVEHDERGSKLYPHLLRVVESYIQESTDIEALVESFAGLIKHKLPHNYELSVDILTEGVIKLLERLIIQEDIERAFKIMEYLEEQDILSWSVELTNPFVQVCLSVGYQRAKILDLNYDLNKYDKLFLNILKRLELMGKRTPVSDCIMQSEEMKDYLDFLEHIPRYDRIEEISEKYEGYYQLVFEQDVFWEGDFCSDDINLYYPEVNQLSDTYPIQGVKFLGNFTVTGGISDERTFHNEGNASVDYEIAGDVTADSLLCGPKNFHVKGGLTAKRYAYFYTENNSNSSFSYSLEIGGKIDAPFFIKVGSSKHKHTGGFCDDCIYISNNTAVGRHIIVHPLSSIREDLRSEYALYIETLVDVYTQGESIFKDGYNPNQNALAGLEKVNQMKVLFEQTQYDEVIAVGATICQEDYYNNNRVPFSRDYYLAKSYLALGGSQNEKKVDKLIKNMQKYYKEGFFDQPSWEMLLFMHSYLARIEQVKGNTRKLLGHMQAANLANADYYQEKANLLWSLGKKKAALFPAYLCIQHFGVDINPEIQNSKEYQAYDKLCSTEGKVPRGYRQTVPAALWKQPFAADLEAEEEMMVWYNGDVYWNGDVDLVEGGELIYPEDVHCNELVIFGDLYVAGYLALCHVDLYVTGNVFVKRLDQVDSKFWCLGSVTCQGDFKIMNDIGGAQTVIYGDLNAPVIVANADRLAVYGSINKSAVVISVCNFLFDETNLESYYPLEDIDFTNISKGYDYRSKENLIFNPEIDLTELICKGKLLKCEEVDLS